MIEDAGFYCVKYYNLTGGVVALHSGFKLWDAPVTPPKKQKDWLCFRLLCLYNQLSAEHLCRCHCTIPGNHFSVGHIYFPSEGLGSARTVFKNCTSYQCWSKECHCNCGISVKTFGFSNLCAVVNIFVICILRTNKTCGKTFHYLNGLFYELQKENF